MIAEQIGNAQRNRRCDCKTADDPTTNVQLQANGMRTFRLNTATRRKDDLELYC